MSDLLDGWVATIMRLRGRGDVAEVGVELLRRYAEPHRRYHDVAHLDDVLHHVDDLASHADLPDAVRVAAWFHDAVYDPRAHDNEQRSAALADSALTRLRLEPAVVSQVTALVRATASHAAAPGDNDAAVLCDADLAILASNENEYAGYVQRVRAEYAHLSDAEFTRGRNEVLRRLLAPRWLFATATGRSRWEEAARRNITRELGG